MVGVWGQSPYAHRGERMATKHGVPLLRIEDAFLRSLHPGRSGEPPLGLLLDRSGGHFDPSTVSDLETLLATHPLDDHALLERARGAMARMQDAHLTKYSVVDPADPVPEPGYVLVIDQTEGDASVRASGADRNRFLEMLYWAQDEHPGQRIVIRTHPETRDGFRAGHYRAGDATGRVTLFTAPASPQALLEGAIAVYTVSSQMGFEAILAGHRPRVFGQPFYAGWGLTEEETPLPRRQRRLTRAQLFAASMILYPTWYDPYRDHLCELEDVLATLEARARAWREDRHGWVAENMRLWKRKPLQGVFGSERPVVFVSSTRGDFGWWAAGAGANWPPPGRLDNVLDSSEGLRSGSANNDFHLFHWWSYHNTGAQFLFVDGSARFLSYSIDHHTLLDLSSRDGAEVVAGF